MVIREILVEQQSIAWLPWAVSYFFFIGLAFSAVFAGLWIRYNSKNNQHEFIAIMIALVCAIVAPVALMADLHQPSRIANFYLHPTPWSWMAWGAVFLPLFTVSVVGYFLSLLRQTIPVQHIAPWLKVLYWGDFNLARWTTVFRFLSFLFSVLILLYTAMEVFMVAARPLWHHYGLILLILCSALPTALLICQCAIQLVDRSFKLKSLTLIGLCNLFGFVATILWLYFSNDQAGAQLTQLWQLSILPKGLLGCWIALIVLFFLPNRFLINIVSVLVALVFTWLFRWILLIMVQGLPKYNALVHFHTLTWKLDEAIGMLSMFSLCVFIGILCWQFFGGRLGGYNE
ncbi:tetrathionate reductase subunit C [Vespertiliibacter pulmonis]|uniref:Tetrathionate reductase gamma subunit n=1 Tax=Vespertiliibacter pulmonis TaxID=1443036 RepID=A0A3N4VR66_9PAST|nr:NrfD/PsrC family molybdoenzyme membrane anchor subunit [Vespertiliibacter pulmonis]QLB21075.1 tetrathionate reductase subunit C [Vespertiliibacter pulmonis]RPE83825.1 tetrathionate reductase gamma subunit [Vespertiliibacter pulmonis]